MEPIDFYFKDPRPNVPLDQITQISVRARSWLARASVLPTFSKPKSVQISGGVFMLAGLDYHYHQFMMHVAALDRYYQKHARLKWGQPLPADIDFSQRVPNKEERHHLDALDHEAIAYLNRIGQFFQFAKAMRLETHLPNIKRLKIFRDKHTAHRSIDSPQADPPQLQQMHAMAFHFSHQMQYSRTEDKCFPTFQITDKRGRHYILHMHDDHPLVMVEAMDLFQAICKI